jgi:hypothetical protein
MTLPVRRLLSGRGWAYAGAILGGLTSIAANVAHSYVPPQQAPPGWAPPPGAVSVKTVQLALGHSTPTITLNEYVHEWPDVLDRTRALVDGALGTPETAVRSAGSRA